MKDVNFTLRVETHLRALDDFASVPMLAAATHLSRNQVSAALHNLRKVRAVDVVVDPDGVGWWYARPKEEDARVRHLVEIKQGIKRPRRNWRRGKVV